MIQSDRFRLLISPAVLLVNSLVLVVLLGVIPSLLIPLFRRDRLTMIVHLPWLLGIISGAVVGVVLACWTTRRLASASDQLVGDVDHDLKTLEAILSIPGPKESEDRWRSAIFVFLLSFFMIHTLIHVVTPVPAVGRWLQRPERTYATSSVSPWDLQVLISGIGDIWRPTLVLCVEAFAAAILLALWRLWPSQDPRADQSDMKSKPRLWTQQRRVARGGRSLGQWREPSSESAWCWGPSRPRIRPLHG